MQVDQVDDAELVDLVELELRELLDLQGEPRRCTGHVNNSKSLSHWPRVESEGFEPNTSLRGRSPAGAISNAHI